MGLLAALAKTNDLYYLHPSFGYYFEVFYLEPHGLAYKLETLPNDTLSPPKPTTALIDANNQFWAQTGATAFPPIIRAVSPPDSDMSQSFGENLLGRFHVQREPNRNSSLVGLYYSRSLNYWGVQLQRMGDLTNAAADFELAQKLNPDNVAAGLNLDFNGSLQTGASVTVDPAKVTPDQFGKYRSWNDMLNACGPFDDPSFTFVDGVVLMRSGLRRQAVEPFKRVCQVAPDYLPARLWLAQAYLVSRMPDSALATLRAPMENPAKFSLNETNSAQLNIVAATAYFQKDDNARGIQLIQTEISRQPTNDALLATAAQIYLRRGLFANALGIINGELQKSPEDPGWLFGKGFTEIQLKNYTSAIPVLTHLLSIQPTNNDALFNRAIAYLESGQLDAAHADYEQLGQSFTNAFQIAYGLGEIAWRKHDTNEAIKQYEAYLSTANPRTAEATNITARLRELKVAPH